MLNNKNIDNLKIHKLLESDGKNEQEAMDFIRKKDNEWIYLFDKTGKQTARYEGNENYVNPPEVQLLLRLNNATVVHNHPSSESFSLEDIEAIVRYNAKKIIVVSLEYTYIAERSDNFWRFDLQHNEQDIIFLEECKVQAERTLARMRNQGFIDTTQKNEDFNHYVWKYFFEDKNISYERVRYRKNDN